MSVVIPSGFGLVSIWSNTEGDSEEMCWTFGVDVSGNSDPASCAGEIQEAWHDHLEGLTSQAVIQTRVTLKMGPVGTGATYEFAANDQGTNTEALAPPNCAVLAQKHTTLGGRKGRGRAYLPGISSISNTMNSAGVFGASEAGEVQTALNSMQAQLMTEPTNGPIEQVLLHSDATSPTPILNWTVSTKLATQRRRLRP